MLKFNFFCVVRRLVFLSGLLRNTFATVITESIWANRVGRMVIHISTVLLLPYGEKTNGAQRLFSRIVL